MEEYAKGLFTDGLLSVFGGVFGFIIQSPFILLNHLLQTIFFSFAIGEILALLLKVIGFVYYEHVSRMKFIHISAGIFFLYAKIWQEYNFILSILSLMSIFIVSFYVYDCISRIQQNLNKTQANKKQFLLIFTFILAAIGVILVVYFAKYYHAGNQVMNDLRQNQANTANATNTTNPTITEDDRVIHTTTLHKNPNGRLQYDNFGLFLGSLFLMTIGNIIRRRSLININLQVFLSCSIVIFRYFQHIYMLDSSWKAAKLPLGSIIYILMALDSEKKERIKTQNDRYLHLFSASIYYFIYTMLKEKGGYDWEFGYFATVIFALILNR